MELKILSVNEAVDEVCRKPYHWNVISIGHNDHPPLTQSKTKLKLIFDDVDDIFIKEQQDWIKTHLIIKPNKEHIQQALEFSRKNWDGPLLIHCHAGISRSPAIAFLILFDKFREVNFVVDYLYKTRSIAIPNERILRIGLKHLVSSKVERLEIWKQIISHPKWQRHKRNIGLLIN